jgi:monofunctional glycosyltransferase
VAEKKNSLLNKTWRFIKRIFLFIFIFHLLYLLYCKWFPPPVTFTQLNSLIDGDGLRRTYVSFDQISPYARLAVMASEDQNFPTHHGFDWQSINKAEQWNKQHPNMIHGASTISQQVAKNIFLWQDRTWIRKGIETYFTFMIELLYSKQRILELYLNEAQMGKGIYGIEAASEIYFHHSAKTLSPTESAMIAGCLPNPVLFTVKPMSGFVAYRYPWILYQMNHLRGDTGIEKLLK